MNDIYNKAFYRKHVDDSLISAEIIVPLILNAFPAESVNDIGCGTGNWLQIFKRFGVRDIRGWDVNDMAGEEYAIEKNEIHTGCDFSSSDFKIDKSADICISLEVAEHLPEANAESFVLNLIDCSRVVIFSAAYPGQSGVNHVNEQPPWYWRNIFNQHGYLEIDFLRPLIWKNEKVSWWYQQNITSFVHPEYIKKSPAALALFKEHGQRNGPHRLTLVNEWILERQLAESGLITIKRHQCRLRHEDSKSRLCSSNEKLILELANNLLQAPLSPDEDRLIAEIFTKYNQSEISNAFIARAQSKGIEQISIQSDTAPIKESKSHQISGHSSSINCRIEDEQIGGVACLEKIPTHLSEKEKKQLHRLARLKASNGAVFVELGSYLGGSSCYIADAIKLSRSNTCLYCIDTWSNEGMAEGLRDTYLEFQQNIKPFQDIVIPLRGKTDQVACYFKKKIDFLFIDADHSYEAVARDIKNWLPLLKPDAIIAFHDYTWFDGVKHAVQKYLTPLEAQPGQLTDSLYYTSIDSARIQKEDEKPKLLFVMPALERIYYYNPQIYAYESHTKLMPNVSGLFIGSYLQQYNFEVNLFDFVEYYRKDSTLNCKKLWQYLKTRIDLYSPDLIAMNVWPQTLEICSYFTSFIKREFSHLDVIWGGHFVSLAHEKELMATPADYFIKYGGEIPLQKILAGKSIYEVENVLYKSPKGIVSTTEKIFTDVDYEIDLNWSLLDTTTYFKTVMDLEGAIFASTAMVIFNRGCPNRCNFCIAQNGTFPKPVWLSNQSLIHEINKLHTRYGVGHIHVADDLTFRSQKNLLDFFDEFQKTAAFGKIKFTISTRADRLKEKNYLTYLERAGVVSVRVGVESDSESILKRMDKKSSTDFNRAILRNAYESSVKHIYMMISGYLDETRRDAVQSIKYLMRNLNINSRFWVSAYELYRGTHDYQHNSHRMDCSNYTSMTAVQARRYDRFIRHIESAHNIRFSIKSLVDIYCKNNPLDKKLIDLTFKSKPAKYFYDLSVDPNLFTEQNRLWRKYYLLEEVPQPLLSEFHDTILILYLSKRIEKLKWLVAKHAVCLRSNPDLVELMIKLAFYDGEVNKSIALIDSAEERNCALINLRKFIMGFDAFARQHRQYLSAEKIPFLNRSSSNPYLSVIIPTMNRANLLSKALESLTNQTYSQELFEVIVIDNGSKDKTAEVCKQYERKFKNFKYVYERQPGLHIGRHKGMTQAAGEILVYGDDDIRAFPSWLAGVADGFRQTDVAMVGGKILPDLEGEAPEWYEQIWTKCKFGRWLGWYSLLDFGDSVIEIPARYIWGCNFSIRREILFEVGGFHPDAFPKQLLKYRGDGETAVSDAIEKCGYKTLYHPDASVYHWISRERMTPKYLYERAFAQGISDSFTMIRSGGIPGETKEFKPCNEDIKDIIQKGYCRGYNYHQEETVNDPWLLKWIKRGSYLSNCPDKNMNEFVSSRLAELAASN